MNARHLRRDHSFPQDRGWMDISHPDELGDGRPATYHRRCVSQTSAERLDDCDQSNSADRSSRLQVLVVVFCPDGASGIRNQALCFPEATL